MNIAFRVDASGQIGTGHFMRCLTLAENLHFKGVVIRFVSRHLPEYLREMLFEKGYELILLNGAFSDSIKDDLPHSHWLECSQQRDAQDSAQALSDRTWDWLIVDHYALDTRWESVMRQGVKKILVIDDIADRQHDCELLLDQNFYTDMHARYTGKVPAQCKLLIGPRYALLREEFRLLRQQLKPRTGPVKRIHVFFGGGDSYNYTEQTINALANLDMHELHVDVVISAQHPFRQQIESACCLHKFTCHIQTDRIAVLIAEADLAISAGGSTTWERCCLGLPTIAFSTADNQFRQINDAAAAGLLYAPEIDGNFTTLLTRHLFALIKNNNLRELISSRAMVTVDGRGVLRIIRKMGCSGIKIRLATQDDSEKLFNWRNHPSIRYVSRHSGEISWPDHQKWYSAVLFSSERVLLIGEFQERPVGVVRFDIEGNEAEVSIYIVPNINMPGIGQDLLQSAEDWLVKFRPEIRKINAEVLGDNARSHHLFLEADYQVEQTSYSKSIYEQA